MLMDKGSDIPLVSPTVPTGLRTREGSSIHDGLSEAKGHRNEFPRQGCLSLRLPRLLGQPVYATHT